MALGKMTKGRQKIEMKLIHDDNARRITFTKRRGGLFKKATELSALCGAEIAIIVLSAGGGKAYSFGHPFVDSVLRKFADGDDVVPEDHDNGFPNDGGKLLRLTVEFDKMEEEVEIARQRGKELDKALKGYLAGLISGEYLSRAGITQLQRLKEAFEKLRDDVRRAVGGLAEDLNLANVERELAADRACDPIPCNWLKL